MGSLFVVSYWISTSNHNENQNSLFDFVLYLIEFLHQTTTLIRLSLPLLSCILLNFYIKPQQIMQVISRSHVVSYWISTSNHNFAGQAAGGESVVSYWISTSNHNGGSRYTDWLDVVSYWISTSNHNAFARLLFSRPVVSYWISTSNHNCVSSVSSPGVLYLIEFLHQTTTSGRLSVDSAYFAAVWWFPKSAFRSSAKSIWCLFSYFKEQI